MQDDLINYKNGIRFECQGSGKCCVSRDSYGFVYLSNIDLKRFSKYFKLSLKAFKNKAKQDKKIWLSWFLHWFTRRIS